jgi:hypothetical protein
MDCPPQWIELVPAVDLMLLSGVSKEETLLKHIVITKYI